MKDGYRTSGLLSIWSSETHGLGGISDCSQNLKTLSGLGSETWSFHGIPPLCHRLPIYVCWNDFWQWE